MDRIHRVDELLTFFESLSNEMILIIIGMLCGIYNKRNTGYTPIISIIKERGEKDEN